MNNELKMSSELKTLSLVTLSRAGKLLQMLEACEPRMATATLIIQMFTELDMDVERQKYVDSVRDLKNARKRIRRALKKELINQLYQIVREERYV